MVFEFSAEQEQFRQVLRQFFQEKSPSREVRRLMEDPQGYDTGVWSQLASQLGLCGLIVPESLGGLGFGQVELAIALEEMGRVLYCGPFFSSVVLGANALLIAGGDVAQAYLPGIASGEIIATLAIAEESGSFLPEDVAVVASRSGAGFEVSGHKRLVTDGELADLVLVVARLEGKVALLAVEGDARGLTREAEQGLDRTRRLAGLRFAATPARVVGTVGRGADIVEETLRTATVALAAEQVGGAQACLDMAVEYAKHRVQFGRAIGSFQAVKHLLADTLVEVESARSAAYYAAWAAAEETDEVAMAASLAKATCSDAYVLAAQHNLQVHGGIGFTWELDCHLYIRRAKSSAVFLGSPSQHREVLAGSLGL